MFYVQQVYQAKEVIESNVQIKQALCATIIDTDRVCLGTEDGLFCIELMKESKYKPVILNQARAEEKSSRVGERSARVDELTRSQGELTTNQRELTTSQGELTTSQRELTTSQRELTRSQ